MPLVAGAATVALLPRTDTTLASVSRIFCVVLTTCECRGGKREREREREKREREKREREKRERERRRPEI